MSNILLLQQNHKARKSQWIFRCAEKWKNFKRMPSYELCREIFFLSTFFLSVFLVFEYFWRGADKYIDWLNWKTLQHFWNNFKKTGSSLSTFCESIKNDISQNICGDCCNWLVDKWMNHRFNWSMFIQILMCWKCWLMLCRLWTSTLHWIIKFFSITYTLL